MLGPKVDGATSTTRISFRLYTMFQSCQDWYIWKSLLDHNHKYFPKLFGHKIYEVKYTHTMQKSARNWSCMFILVQHTCCEVLLKRWKWQKNKANPVSKEWMTMGKYCAIAPFLTSYSCFLKNKEISRFRFTAIIICVEFYF